MTYTLRLGGRHIHEENRQAAIEVIGAAISEGHSVLEIICSEGAEPLSLVDVLDWREAKADRSPPEVRPNAGLGSRTATVRHHEAVCKAKAEL